MARPTADCGHLDAVADTLGRGPPAVREGSRRREVSADLPKERPQKLTPRLAPRPPRQLLTLTFKPLTLTFPDADADADAAADAEADADALRLGSVGLWGHGLDDALEVVDGGELDGDLALVAAHLYFDPGLEQIRQPVGEVT